MRGRGVVLCWVLCVVVLRSMLLLLLRGGVLLLLLRVLRGVVQWWLWGGRLRSRPLDMVLLCGMLLLFLSRRGKGQFRLR